MSETLYAQQKRVKAEKELEREANRILDYLASVPVYANTTTSRRVANKMLSLTDGWIMARGEMWDVKVKSLGVGVYRVTLEKKAL